MEGYINLFFSFWYMTRAWLLATGGWFEDL